MPRSAAPAVDRRRIGLLARDFLDLLGDRWSALVIYALHEGPLRFSDLKSRIDESGPNLLRRTEVSHKMLAGTLRNLRRNGLVVRSRQSDDPRHAEYALSPLGESFWTPMMAVRRWTLKNLDEIEEARRRFDQMASPTPRSRVGAGARPIGEETSPTAARNPTGGASSKRADDRR